MDFLVRAINMGKKWLATPAAAVLLLLSTACEDDPIVEPKEGTKTGGSYGGRLTQPDHSHQNKRNAAVFAAPTKNPEVF